MTYAAGYGVGSAYKVRPDLPGTRKMGGLGLTRTDVRWDPPLEAKYAESFTPYWTAVLADTPKLYLRLEEAASPVLSEVGGHSGTVTGATLGQIGAVYPGRSVYFAGVSDFIEVPDHADFDITGDLTLEAWVNFDTGWGAGYQEVIVKQNSGDNPTFEWRVNFADNMMFVDKTAGGARQNFATTNIIVNTWTHIAFVREGTNFRHYVNGVLSGSDTVTAGTPLVGTGTVRIGLRNDGVSPMKGYVDEVAIYDHVVSAERLLFHFNARDHYLPVQPQVSTSGGGTKQGKGGSTRTVTATASGGGLNSSSHDASGGSQATVTAARSGTGRKGGSSSSTTATATATQSGAGTKGGRSGTTTATATGTQTGAGTKKGLSGTTTATATGTQTGAGTKQALSGTSTAPVTVARTGAGSKQGLSGTTTVTVTATQTGGGRKNIASGSNATATATQSGAGTKGGRSGSSTATVTATQTGAGSKQGLSSTSTATVTGTQTGAGSKQGRSGTSTATVTVIASGAGTRLGGALSYWRLADGTKAPIFTATGAQASVRQVATAETWAQGDETWAASTQAWADA